MTALADLISGFAALLKPGEGKDVELTDCTTVARPVDPPYPRSFTNGLKIDRLAANSGLALP